MAAWDDPPWLDRILQGVRRSGLARGLGESGYTTATGLARLADYIPGVDTSGQVEALEQGRRELERFYEPAGTGLSYIGGRILGDVAQFAVTGGAATAGARGAAALAGRAAGGAGRLAPAAERVARVAQNIASRPIATSLVADAGVDTAIGMGSRPEESMLGALGMVAQMGPQSGGLPSLGRTLEEASENPWLRAAGEVIPGAGIGAGLARLGGPILRQTLADTPKPTPSRARQAAAGGLALAGLGGIAAADIAEDNGTLPGVGGGAALAASFFAGKPGKGADDAARQSRDLLDEIVANQPTDERLLGAIVKRSENPLREWLVATENISTGTRFGFTPGAADAPLLNRMILSAEIENVLRQDAFNGDAIADLLNTASQTPGVRVLSEAGTGAWEGTLNPNRIIRFEGLDRYTDEVASNYVDQYMALRGIVTGQDHQAAIRVVPDGTQGPNVRDGYFLSFPPDTPRELLDEAARRLPGATVDYRSGVVITANFDGVPDFQRIIDEALAPLGGDMAVAAERLTLETKYYGADRFLELAQSLDSEAAEGLAGLLSRAKPVYAKYAGEAGAELAPRLDQAIAGVRAVGESGKSAARIDKQMSDLAAAAPSRPADVPSAYEAAREVLHSTGRKYRSIPSNASTQARIERLIRGFTAELKAFLEEPDASQMLGWYRREQENAMDIATLAIPELADPSHRGLLSYVTGLLSANSAVVPNWNSALVTYGQYIKTGRLSRFDLTKPRTVRGHGRGGGRPIPGGALNTSASQQDKVLTRIDRTLRRLRDDLGYSDQAAREALLDLMTRLAYQSDAPGRLKATGLPPMRGILEENPSVWQSLPKYSKPGTRGNLRPTAKEGELVPAATRILGTDAQKIGRFGMGLAGIVDEATVDIWMHRIADLVMGAKQHTPKKFPDVYQDEIREALEILARRSEDIFGQEIPAADIQAALWYQGKRLFARAGWATPEDTPATAALKWARGEAAPATGKGVKATARQARIEELQASTGRGPNPVLQRRSLDDVRADTEFVTEAKRGKAALDDIIEGSEKERPLLRAIKRLATDNPAAVTAGLTAGAGTGALVAGDTEEGGALLAGAGLLGVPGARRALGGAGWVSPALRAVQSSDMGSATGARWAKLVDSRTTKAEKEWLNLGEVLDPETRYTREEVEAIVQQRRPQLREGRTDSRLSFNGNDIVFESDPQYSTPVGRVRQEGDGYYLDFNDAEEFIYDGEPTWSVNFADTNHLEFKNLGPFPTKEAAQEEVLRVLEDGGINRWEDIDDFGEFSMWVQPGRSTNYREIPITLENLREGAFTDGHFGENTLAHMRTTDREIAGVGKGLHVEEMQSDWHQQGRQRGYRSGTRSPQEEEKLAQALRNAVNELQAAEDTYSDALSAILDYKRKSGDGFVKVLQKHPEIQEVRIKRTELPDEPYYPMADYQVRSWNPDTPRRGVQVTDKRDLAYNPINRAATTLLEFTDFNDNFWSAAERRLRDYYGGMIPPKEPMRSQEQMEAAIDYLLFFKVHPDDRLKVLRALPAYTETLGRQIGQKAMDLRDARSRMTNAKIEVDRAGKAKHRPGLPDAPFKESSEWTRLLVRRAIQMAAEEGKDFVSFPTGEQASQLFGLAGQVRSLEVTPEPRGGFRIKAERKDGSGAINQVAETKERLAEYIGATPAREALAGIQENGKWSVEGAKIPGEAGVAKYYNEIARSVIEKEARRLGLNVELHDMRFGDDARYEELMEIYNNPNRSFQMHEPSPPGPNDRTFAGANPVIRLSPDARVRVLANPMELGAATRETVQALATTGVGAAAGAAGGAAAAGEDNRGQGALLGALAGAGLTGAGVAAGLRAGGAERKALEREARTDVLTGLTSRRGDVEGTEAALKNRKPGERVVRLRVDMDNFKAINDNLSHAEGDRALKAAGDAMQEALRDVDGVTVSRVGGDEFAATLTVARDADPAAIAMRVEEAMNRGLLEAGFDVVGGKKVGASVGWADAQRQVPYSELDDAADQAATRRKAERKVSVPRDGAPPPPAPPPSPQAVARGRKEDLSVGPPLDPADLDAEDYARRFQFGEQEPDATGAFTPTAKRFDAKVREIGARLGGKQKISWEETREMAASFGFRANEIVAKKAKDLSGPEMLAIREMVSSNLEELERIHQRIASMGPGSDPVQVEMLERAADFLESQNAELLGKFIRARSEAGRRLNSLKIMANRTLDPVVWQLMAMRHLGRPLSESSGEAAELRRILAEGNREEAVKFVTELYQPTLGEKLETLWKAGLLSGPRTQLANILGNTAMSGLEAVKDPVAAVVDGLVGFVTGQRTSTFNAGMVRASFTGAIEGFKKSGQILRRGSLPEDLARRANLPREVHFKNPFLEFYTQAIFRSLSAGDRPGRHAAMARSLYEQASLIAKKEGLTGAAARARTTEIVENPPMELFLRAEHDGLVASFMNESRLANTAETLRRNLGPAGQVLLPFARTPANVADMLYRYSPVGGAVATAELAVRLLKHVTGAEAMTPEIQRRLAKDIARAGVGMPAIALGAALALKDRMTGAFPSVGSEDRERWLQEGRGSASVKMSEDDTVWRSVERISPLGNLMVVGAAWARLHQDGASLSEQITGAAAETGLAVVQQSFLSGINDALEALQFAADQEGGGKRMAARYVQNLAASTIPAVVGGVARGMDPMQRDPQTLVETLKSRIPVLSQDVPASVDALGREKERFPGMGPVGRLFAATTDPFYPTADRRSDPIIGELADKDVVVRRPQIPSEARGGPRRGSPEWRDQYGAAGQANQQAVLMAMQNPQWRGAEQLAQQYINSGHPKYAGRSVEDVAREIRQDLISTYASSYRELGPILQQMGGPR